ncbi:MAG: aminotransferase class III-fold pyridoxal phosphate-dependent enzyme, partial [Campylobacterota bacterium]
GTFRGNNLAFVASKVAIDKYWQNDEFAKSIKYKENILKERLLEIAAKYQGEYDIDVRGRGFAYGFEIKNDNSLAGEISGKGFEHNLIIETAGSEDQVVKFLPPLIIDEDTLREGLKRFEASLDDLIKERKENISKEF